MKRMKMSKRYSNKKYRKGMKVKKLNFPRLQSRGGIRL